MGSVAPSLYKLRHGGPSHDIAAVLRSLATVKKRGRWGTDASVRRYEKGARLAEQMDKLTPEVRDRALTAWDQLDGLLWASLRRGRASS